MRKCYYVRFTVCEMEGLGSKMKAAFEIESSHDAKRKA